MPDLDNLFKYCTPKYVYIRDKKLGIMKYSMMGAIFGYVVVYNILYTCDHLPINRAMGFGSITMQHPVDDCDETDKECLSKFHNIDTLPYCSQFAGDKSRLLSGDEQPEPKDLDRTPAPTSEKKEIGDKIAAPKMCRYLDNRRLEWEAGVPSEVFVPTGYKQVKQKINKNCYNPELDGQELGGGEGADSFRCKTGWITTETKEYYVADIERFTLRMSHSFSAPPIGMYGVSEDFQGVLAACKSNHPLDVKAECVRTKVPNSAGDMAPEDEEGLSTAEAMGIPSLKGTEGGLDEISLKDLLKVTPVAQRYPKVRENVLDARLPDEFGHAGESLREVGGIMMPEVEYANNGYGRPGFRTWPAQYQIKPVTYTYRPHFVPTNSNHNIQLVQKSDHADTRTVDIWYGITIKMQFNGELVAFSYSKVLTALTSGLVLLSMATTLVCYAASFLLPMQEKYNGLMYQMSDDMSDFGKYRDRQVKGLGQWINPLGLLSDKKWDDMPSVGYAGTLLLSKLSDSGSPLGGEDGKLTNSEVIKLLCQNEVRLNRLDAMDVRMIFDDSNEAQQNGNKLHKLNSKCHGEFYGAGPAE